MTVIQNPEAPSLRLVVLGDVKRGPLSMVDKPVLDEITFHQLLSAAYTLQQHNRHSLVKRSQQQGAAACHARNLETASLKRLQSKPVQHVSLAQRAVPSATVPLRPGSIVLQSHWLRLGDGTSSFRMALKRVYRSHELLWSVAIVVAGVGISALLLVGTKPVVMGQPLATKTRETPVATQTTVNPSRTHSIFESEADVVAKDTVVRYGTHSAPTSRSRVRTLVMRAHPSREPRGRQRP